MLNEKRLYFFGHTTLARLVIIIFLTFGGVVKAKGFAGTFQIETETIVVQAVKGDQCDPSLPGSIANIVQKLGKARLRMVLLGPSNFDFHRNFVFKRNISLLPQAGATLFPNLSIRTEQYRWKLSDKGTGEFFLELASGGNPDIAKPVGLRAAGIGMPSGILGVLSPGQWSWGDNDKLGFPTLYVRLPDNACPDAKGMDSLHAYYTITIENLSSETGTYQWINTDNGGNVVFGSKATDAVLLEYWGGTPDGSTDCTMALNCALASHLKVKLQKGVYRYSVPLRMPDFSSLIGSGPGCILHRYCDGQSCVGIFPGNYCTLKNFTLRGPGKKKYLPGAKASVATYQGRDPGSDHYRSMEETGWRGAHLTIDNMVIENWPGGGVGIGPYSLICNSILKDCLGEAILVSGNNSSIMNNIINGFPSWGVDINASHILVSENKIFACGDFFRLGGGDGGGIVLCAANHINGIADVTVSNNAIIDSDMYGILLVTNSGQVSLSPVLTECQITKNMIANVMKNFTENDAAISLADNSLIPGSPKVFKIMVKNNIIYNVGQRSRFLVSGIRGRAVRAVTVENNTIDGVTEYPIYFKGHLAGNPSGIKIIENILRDFPTKAIVLKNCAHSFQEGNIVEYNAPRRW